MGATRSSICFIMRANALATGKLLGPAMCDMIRGVKSSVASVAPK